MLMVMTLVLNQIPGPEADRANPTKAVVNLDVTPPAFPDAVTAGSVAPKAGETLPTSNELADPFNVLVDLVDDNLVATTITFTAVPNELTFGEAGWLGGTRYRAEATPKALDEDDEDEDGSN